jgi:lysozyme
MDISDEGIEFIKQVEGYSATAYPDPATGGAPWTAGFGHTKGVRYGDQTDMEQATRWLHEDVREALAAIQDGVRVPLEQNQIDALASFVFNVGVGNFMRSTLLRRINEQKFEQAADEFLRWNRAGGKIMAGLTRRREAERRRFLGQA